MFWYGLNLIFEIEKPIFLYLGVEPNAYFKPFVRKIHQFSELLEINFCFEKNQNHLFIDDIKNWYINTQKEIPNITLIFKNKKLMGKHSKKLKKNIQKKKRKNIFKWIIVDFFNGYFNSRLLRGSLTRIQKGRKCNRNADI